jgi:hypothetical protein
VTTPIDIVLAWQLAVSKGDLDRALALSSEDIEVGGPRGSGRGHQLVRDWVGRTGIELDGLRSFQRGPIVVIEQCATWRLPGGSRSTKTIGTAFEVVGGRVGRVMRYDSLGEALAAAGLTEGDEVP